MVQLKFVGKYFLDQTKNTFKYKTDAPVIRDRIKAKMYTVNEMAFHTGSSK